MRALNLGCGARFHPDWENVDFIPADPSVKRCDLRRGVPYADNSFDVVYHSHVLEHFSKQDAARFLRECLRILKREGILRVAVPDLEGIARYYLQSLEGAASDPANSDANHEWMLLEMYDQTVRETPGGECAEFYARKPFPNWDFVSMRMGSFAESVKRAVQSGALGANGNGNHARNWSYIVRHPGSVVRNKMARLILGKDDWECLQVGRFRNGGEIHKWMYDSHSLARLLESVGFREPQKCMATNSRIPDWTAFQLDSEADGKPYKADSLYMEAIKP